MNQRSIALEILSKSISDNSYTNLLMRERLNQLPSVQRPFVTNLVMGVLKNYDLLLYQVRNDINEHTALKNKIILAMAIYERFYLKEKAYVVNNEYVALGKNKYDQAFINAVLRKTTKFVKADQEWLNNSLPEWLYKLLNKQYDTVSFQKILNNYQRVPKLYYRINHHKADVSTLSAVEFINEDIFLSKNNLLASQLMKAGYFYIQDLNSAELYKHLKLQKTDLLLDVCSAPGSKLFNCLDIVKAENAYANDLHEKRVKLIEQKAEILGFKGIHYLNLDGRKLKDNLNLKFQKIMLDAPCSGLGTIGHKPDLKFHLRPEALDELQVIQQELLESVKDLLTKDGLLLYSTCTLNKKENRKQIDLFLKNNDNFVLIEDDTIINDLGDCFYYAVLKRI